MADDDDWGQGLDQRISDYLEDRDQPVGTVGLPQVLEALGADIRAARKMAARNNNATLLFKDASVELEVTTTYSGEAGAKVKFWVFTEAGVTASAARARGTKITVNLLPVDASIPLAEILPSTAGQ